MYVSVLSGCIYMDLNFGLTSVESHCMLCISVSCCCRCAAVS